MRSFTDALAGRPGDRIARARPTRPTPPGSSTGIRRLALFAAGCAATLPELREWPPQRTAMITTERSSLASCIVSGLRAADPGTLRTLAGGLMQESAETRAAPHSGAGLRRVLDALLRPRPSCSPHVDGVVGRGWARR